MVLAALLRGPEEASSVQEALKHEYSHPLLPEEAFNYAAICLNFVNGLLILGTRLGMPLEPPDALPIINAVRVAASIDWDALMHLQQPPVR